MRLSNRRKRSEWHAFRIKRQDISRLFGGGPLETRTPDPLIKSQLLYQLS